MQSVRPEAKTLLADYNETLGQYTVERRNSDSSIVFEISASKTRLGVARLLVDPKDLKLTVESSNSPAMPLSIITDGQIRLKALAARKGATQTEAFHVLVKTAKRASEGTEYADLIGDLLALTGPVEIIKSEMLILRYRGLTIKLHRSGEWYMDYDDGRYSCGPVTAARGTYEFPKLTDEKAKAILNSLDAPEALLNLIGMEIMPFMIQEVKERLAETSQVERKWLVQADTPHTNDVIASVTRMDIATVLIEKLTEAGKRLEAFVKTRDHNGFDYFTEEEMESLYIQQLFERLPECEFNLYSGKTEEIPHDFERTSTLLRLGDRIISALGIS